MYRNLDLVSLRTMIAISETGGMTRAANAMHLTQSAVSMQVKRLEEQLSVKLLKREGRQVSPTLEGDQLIAYARRLVDLNDEALRSMAQPEHTQTINFGVPIDLVHPFIPHVLRLIQRECPRYRINLTSGLTYDLRHSMRDGLHDIILTTEKTPSAGGTKLTTQALVWSTAKGGQCWKNTPLPLAFSPRCMFLKPAVEAIDNAGMQWTHLSSNFTEDNALVCAAADMGMRAELACTQLSGVAPIEHQDALPPLPEYSVVMYTAERVSKDVARDIGDIVSRVFVDLLADD